MAQVEGKAVINNFVGGLVTDFHELNTPQNVTVDEDNCDLDRKGSRKRRLGIDYETGYEFGDTVVSTNLISETYLKTYEWEAVNNDGNLNFLVVQVGNVLSFFDTANDAISPNEKSFTIDLNTYKTSAVTTVAPYPIQVTSGKGLMFIAGKYITPLRVEYDEDTDTITVTQITMRIRDLVQMLNDADTQGFKTSEADFTLELYYDLYNQGWGTLIKGNDSNNPGAVVTQGMTALGFYRALIGQYPPKSKSWFVGKRGPIDPGEAGFEVFDPSGVYEMVEAGSTLAPLGHFILDPFNKDRNAAIAAQQAANPLTSGFYLTTDFPVEVDLTRPSAIAFYSGRLFYGHKNTIYYSQVLNDDFDNAGQCYQAADPTAEDINELVATDGGTILIPTSGSIVRFVEFQNSLLVFTDNGIWALGGPALGEGFTATGFSLSKVSSVGISSDRSVVLVEGTPMWWNDVGIFVVAPDQAKQSFSVQNICDKKIQVFYDAIPAGNKPHASGAYDERKKVVSWIFNSNSSMIHSNPYACNRVLNYDLLLGAFFPYTISDLTVDSPFIVDVFSASDTVREIEEIVIQDNLGSDITDGGNDVFIESISFVTASDDTGIKFLTFTPVGI